MHVIGACITSVLPGEVCGLAAVAMECYQGSMMATVCECDQGYVYEGAECRGQ